MTDSQPAAPSQGLERLGVFAGPLAGLVGFLVSVACVAVPLLHFVTGPLGPIIGGFVAGRLGRGGFRRMAASALTMAVGMTLVAAAITGALFGDEPSSGWARALPAIFFVYTGTFAVVGAFFGAATALRE